MNTQVKNILLLSIFVGLNILSCSDSKLSDFKRGKIFMELEDFENAVKSFEMAVWDHPNDPDIRYHFADALRNEGNSRKAYQQYIIAARIGSREISDRFTKWAWELYNKGDSDAGEIAELAIISYEKNAEAQFLYGQDQGYNGLPFLRDAIDWSSDKKIVEPTFEYIKKHRALISSAFFEQITRNDDGFEDFGPVVFTTNEDEIIWSRAKKNNWGRYQYKDIKLYAQTVNDTSIEELTNVGTSLAFPCYDGNNSLIYYSQGDRVYQYNRNESTTSRMINGSFVDLSSNNDRILLTRNWNIFISDTSGMTAKQLTRRKRYDYNFMPKFIHPQDSMIVYLSFRDRNLCFFINDTTGRKEKLIAIIDRYGFDLNNPGLNAYDISPDGKYIVFSRDRQLYSLDIETSKEDTLFLYGAYPTFSPDSKRISILTRRYGETGEVAIVDLDELFEANTFFKEGNPDRGKLLRLLKKATEGIEKESLSRSRY
ncbi:MAG: hypothetical protein ACTSYF_14550 [Promethearchaeota archaeon]